MRGQHQSLGRSFVALDPGDHLHAIEPGQADVEDDDIGRLLTGHAHGVDAIVGLADDLQALLAQQHAHRGTYERVVVDHQCFIHQAFSLGRLA